MIRVEIKAHNREFATVEYQGKQYQVYVVELQNVDHDWSYGFVHPSCLRSAGV